GLVARARATARPHSPQATGQGSHPLRSRRRRHDGGAHQPAPRRRRRVDGSGLTMLTSDLALSWRRGGRTGPKALDVASRALVETADALVSIVEEHVGRPRAELAL